MSSSRSDSNLFNDTNSAAEPRTFSKTDIAKLELSPLRIGLADVAQQAIVQTPSPSSSPRALSLPARTPTPMHQYANELAVLYTSPLLTTAPTFVTAAPSDAAVPAPATAVVAEAYPSLASTFPPTPSYHVYQYERGAAHTPDAFTFPLPDAARYEAEAGSRGGEIRFTSSPAANEPIHAIHAADQGTTGVSHGIGGAQRSLTPSPILGGAAAAATPISISTYPPAATSISASAASGNGGRVDSAVRENYSAGVGYRVGHDYGTGMGYGRDRDEFGREFTFTNRLFPDYATRYPDIAAPTLPPLLTAPPLATPPATPPSSSSSLQPSAALLASLATVYSSQVLLGLVAVLDRPKVDAKLLHSQLMSSGIRFVFMSPQSERHTHAFGVEMGIFTGFNHYISLRAPYLDDRDELFLGSSLLPRGVAAVRAHIDHVDNVPLLVSLLSDSTATTATQMVRVYAEHGEAPVLLGSSLSSEFSLAYTLAAAAIAADPLLPKPCRFHRQLGVHAHAAGSCGPGYACAAPCGGGECTAALERAARGPTRVDNDNVDVVAEGGNRDGAVGASDAALSLASPSNHTTATSASACAPLRSLPVSPLHTFEYAAAAAFTSAAASLRLASVFDLTDLSCVFAIARSQAEIGKKVLHFLFYSQLAVFLINFLLEVVGAPALFTPAAAMLFCFLLLPLLAVAVYVSPREFDAMSLISQKKTNRYHLHVEGKKAIRGFLGFSVPLAVVVCAVFVLLVWWLHVPLALMVPDGSTVDVQALAGGYGGVYGDELNVSIHTSNHASAYAFNYTSVAAAAPVAAASVSSVASPVSPASATLTPLVLSLPLREYYFYRSPAHTHVTVTTPSASAAHSLSSSPSIADYSSAPCSSSSSSSSSLSSFPSSSSSLLPLAATATAILSPSLVWHSAEVSPALAACRAIALWLVWVYLLTLSLFFTLKRGEERCRGKRDGGSKSHRVDNLVLRHRARWQAVFLARSLARRAPAWLPCAAAASLCLLAFTLPALIDASAPLWPHAGWAIWLILPIAILFFVFFCEYGVRMQFQRLEQEEGERRDAFLEFDTQLGMHSPVGH